VTCNLLNFNGLKSLEILNGLDLKTCKW